MHIPISTSDRKRRRTTAGPTATNDACSGQPAQDHLSPGHLGFAPPSAALTFLPTLCAAKMGAAGIEPATSRV
jgi:hypothetical protein